MSSFDRSSELDICSICGAPVKRRNLVQHYQKTHPRHVASLVARPVSELSKTQRPRRSRRILFFALIGIAIILVSVVAAQVVSSNTIRMHIHPQLSVLILGASFPVPGNIGIDQALWRDHSLDKYGVTGRSPLSTHDISGTIHVESNTVRNFTLYQFLAVWGVSIDNSQVVGNPVQPGQSACISVDNQVMSSLADVTLGDGQKIILEIIPASCSATI